MKKLAVKKDEGLAEVIDRVLDEPSKEVLVVVPKGSALGKSPRNFNILKNEAELGGKKIFVESSDEEMVALAKRAGIETEPRTGVVDIIPARAHEEDEPKRHSRKTVKLSVEASEEVEPVQPLAGPVEEKIAEETAEEEKTFFAGADRFFKPRKIEEVARDGDDEEGGRGSRGGKRFAIIVGIVVAIAVIFYGVTALFGRADITINFKKTPWQYQGAFTADKAASSITAASGAAANTVLPAQLFTIPKNATQLFPASANQTVSIKAQGTLTIYNAYSSAAQQLVATTRFVTPDGKIFRLVATVTVPGAQVTNGQIVPSSINAQVIADKPGPDYNVGAIAKLTVPGFQGTPKYDGFYGALAAGTTGGFTGQKAVPTAADITAAKAKMTTVLQSGLQAGLANTYPSNFKILDGATNVAITKLTVNTSTDANGNFSVFGEATLQAIGFDEGAFKQYLLTLAQATEPSSTFTSLTLNYSNVKPDFKNGKVSFSLAGQGELEPAFSADAFKASIQGGSVSDARTMIAALPQLQDGSISVWPAWVWNIPGDANKIAISVN